MTLAPGVRGAEGAGAGRSVNRILLSAMPSQPPLTGPIGYRAQSEDTSPEVDRLLFDAYRAMSSWEKARRVDEDALALEQLARLGIQQRHPDAEEQEIRLRLAALRLDRETMIRAFGWDPNLRGL